ncbi:MAG: sulfate adenylyltransferase [Firmicutes bacterium]|nr:sulfate adenylyltransferase [Bacillota bacterium]
MAQALRQPLPETGAEQDSTLVPPHGGSLVSRILSGDGAEAAREKARSLRRIPLDEVRLADVVCIATGVYSPLTGFLGEGAYRSVVEEMRLPDGTVWPLPITLPVPAALAAGLRDGEEVALAGPDGEPLGILRVEERYRPDREAEAVKVYGTADPAHPGVRRTLRQGEVYLAGPIWVWRLPPQPFPDLAMTPAEIRAAFRARGWCRVVAFQTRNPIHRAHEYITKVALEQVDGLFLNPLVGPTKEDDIPADVRVACYRVLLEHYYPAGRVLLAAFPAPMRYAGPREAIFHALCRKNYGASHFIVGRDHAGVGNYYGPYDAQRLFRRFRPEELGITPVFFDRAFWCRRCGGMATDKTCPHRDDDRVLLSGTQVRQMLREGQVPPPEFTRPEVAALLVAAVRKGATP